MKNHTIKKVAIVFIAAMVVSCNGKNGGEETVNCIDIHEEKGL